MKFNKSENFFTPKSKYSHIGCSTHKRVGVIPKIKRYFHLNLMVFFSNKLVWKTKEQRYFSTDTLLVINVAKKSDFGKVSIFFAIWIIHWKQKFLYSRQKANKSSWISSDIFLANTYLLFKVINVVLLSLLTQNILHISFQLFFSMLNINTFIVTAVGLFQKIL